MDAEAFEVLEALGLYLYRDPYLFARVLRVLRHHVASYCCHGAGRAAAGGAGGESAVEVEGEGVVGEEGVAQVYLLLATTVLPALAMVPASFAVSNAVWSVMSLLPFAARFVVYRQAQDVWAKSPVLQVRGREVSVFDGFGWVRCAAVPVLQQPRPRWGSKQFHGSFLVVFWFLGRSLQMHGSGRCQSAAGTWVLRRCALATQRPIQSLGEGSIHPTPMPTPQSPCTSFAQCAPLLTIMHTP